MIFFKIFIATFLVFPSLLAQEEMKTGTYCIDGNVENKCIHILEVTKDENKQTVYKVAFFEGISFTFYDTKNEVYNFSFFDGEVIGSFKKEGNNLKVRFPLESGDLKFYDFLYIGAPPKFYFQQAEEEIVEGGV